MGVSWKNSTFSGAATVFLICLSSVGSVRSQNHTRVDTIADVHVRTSSVDDQDSAYRAQFVDRNGGYKDKRGGYYSVKDGTYTDEHGGVVDNWGGYTYEDGSYKSKSGHFYDAKANVLKLTSGETVKLDPSVTPTLTIKVLRDDVEKNGGYDKDLTRKSMMESILAEHPKHPDQ